MNSLPANNPDWLVKKIIKMGGTISFYDFMNFALNDPIMVITAAVKLS